MTFRLSVAFAFFAAGAVVIALDGCSSDDAAPAGGATPDGSIGTGNDGAIVLADADLACDPDASLLDRVQDAAIADGASTTGICAKCLDERCAYELGHCAEDCQCQGIVGDALQCYLTTQDIACLGRLTNYLVRQDTRARALQLSGCARSSCASECAIDGGVAVDASADAPSSD